MKEISLKYHSKPEEPSNINVAKVKDYSRTGTNDLPILQFYTFYNSFFKKNFVGRATTDNVEQFGTSKEITWQVPDGATKVDVKKIPKEVKKQLQEHKNQLIKKIKELKEKDTARAKGEYDVFKSFSYDFDNPKEDSLYLNKDNTITIVSWGLSYSGEIIEINEDCQKCGQDPCVCDPGGGDDWVKLIKDQWRKILLFLALLLLLLLNNCSPEAHFESKKFELAPSQGYLFDSEKSFDPERWLVHESDSINLKRKCGIRGCLYLGKSQSA